MSILLPCLCMIGLGLLFGVVHIAAAGDRKADPGDGASDPACGHTCATCSFGCCGFAAARDRNEKGDTAE
ncbi:MAG: hypothetical protein IJJ45_04260 [Clostridia bacterium]|nr:hypothetical protein [Clostridia bacterium]